MVVDMDRSLHMASNSKPHLSSAASENFRSACLYWGLFWAGVSTLYAEKDILLLRILKHFTMSLSSALYIVKRLGLGMGMGNGNGKTVGDDSIISGYEWPYPPGKWPHPPPPNYTPSSSELMTSSSTPNYTPSSPECKTAFSECMTSSSAYHQLINLILIQGGHLRGIQGICHPMNEWPHPPPPYPTYLTELDPIDCKSSYTYI